MNPIRCAVRAAVLCAVLLATGCATSRGVMGLQVPAPAATPAPDKLAVIESVQDGRVFELAPRNPSTPSLKKGAAYALDDTQRKQAIARKRNGYGKALGDIVLDGDQTVETLTADLLAAGLAQRGYRVVPAAEAGADALRLRVAIDKFWAWLTPGFWTVSMEAQVHTTVEARVADAAPRTLTINGYGSNTGGTGKEANWRIAYDRAFADYAAKLQAGLDGAGL